MRPKTKQLLDAIFFPYRALFLTREGKFGLSSILEQRMTTVAKYCQGKVLDVGCGPGNLFIKKFYPGEGLGIDVFPYEDGGEIVKDVSNLPYGDESFDTITLIAVGGHLPKSQREKIFKELTRVLKTNGHLIMTEGEPITQYLVHNWYSVYCKLKKKKSVDDERGIGQEEEYCMPKKELLQYLNTSPLKFIKRVKFMWGLNNLYLAQKIKPEELKP
jgi:ubiquinone/menaquinone biosynthesis C-methylase UbiE